MSGSDLYQGMLKHWPALAAIDQWLEPNDRPVLEDIFTSAAASWVSEVDGRDGDLMIIEFVFAGPGAGDAAKRFMAAFRGELAKLAEARRALVEVSYQTLAVALRPDDFNYSTGARS